MMNQIKITEVYDYNIPVSVKFSRHTPDPCRGRFYTPADYSCITETVQPEKGSFIYRTFTKQHVTITKPLGSIH